MAKHAKDTSVSITKTQAEIKNMLMKYGAERYAIAEGRADGAITFVYQKRTIQISITLPDYDDFKYTPARRTVRKKDDQMKTHQTACKQRWRALKIFILAALEAIENGIVRFDDVFLPFMMLPDGQTVADKMVEPMRLLNENGVMPKMLMGGE